MHLHISMAGVSSSQTKPKAPRKPSSTAFKPGQSGNPGGKPKGTKNRRMTPNDEVLAAVKRKGGVDWLADNLPDNTLAQLYARLLEKGLDRDGAVREHEARVEEHEALMKKHELRADQHHPAIPKLKHLLNLPPATSFDNTNLAFLDQFEAGALRVDLVEPVAHA